jgi:hypothetical protein
MLLRSYSIQECGLLRNLPDQGYSSRIVKRNATCSNNYKSCSFRLALCCFCVFSFFPFSFFAAADITVDQVYTDSDFLHTSFTYTHI